MEQSTELNAIEVFALTRKYNALVAVNQLTFSIAPGSHVWLDRPEWCREEHAHQDADDAAATHVRNSPNRRFRLGATSRGRPQENWLCFTNASANGDSTGYENLLITAKLFGIHRSERPGRIAQALEFMDLSHVGNKQVRQYSGGMIRRLEIAQSMLHRPEILFMDEPSVGLDPAAKRSVWERILQLRHEYSTTILMTTHDMEEADHLCDIVGVMHRGVLAAMDTPAALKAKVGPKLRSTTYSFIIPARQFPKEGT